MGFTGQSAGVTPYRGLIDKFGRYLTRSVTESEGQWATERGQAFNLNTKNIGLTSSNDSAVFYYKHNQPEILLVESIIVGVAESGTTSDVTEITVVRNPTAGTIVTNAVGISVNENRNFSSNKTTGASLVYQGVEGDTFTDGSDALFVYAKPPRTAVPINLELEQGASLGIKVNTKTTAGTTNVYIAVVTHLKDSDLVDR